MDRQTEAITIYPFFFFKKRGDKKQVDIINVRTLFLFNILTVLALVDVLGVFTSEISFRTPKFQRSDVL